MWDYKLYAYARVRCKTGCIVPGTSTMYQVPVPCMHTRYQVQRTLLVLPGIPFMTEDTRFSMKAQEPIMCYLNVLMHIACTVRILRSWQYLP